MNRSFDNIRGGESDSEFLVRELKGRITIDTNLEKLVLIGFTNRTNTGALTTALGHIAGATRHVQPIKAIARQIMESHGQASSTPLQFLKNTIEIGPGLQIVKETIGPNLNNPAEWMDSLQLLLDKGLDPKKTCLIPTFRDPFDVISSWKRMWNFTDQDFPFESFNKSFLTVDKTISLASSMGIKVVPYVHEFLRDFNPENVMRSMLNTLDLPFSPQIINWKADSGDPYFSSGIVKYDLPPDAWVQGSLNIKKGGRGGLIWKAMDSKWQMSNDEISFFASQIMPAIEIHKKHTQQAKLLLKL